MSSSSPIISEVEHLWAGMIAAAQARDPDRIEAAYAPTPVVAINGIILADYHAHFAGVRSWLQSLQSMDARYDDVHVELLAPDVVVATMRHHLAWTDATGAPGEWHSAWTAVCRKGAEGWRILYAHESVAPAASAA